MGRGIDWAVEDVAQLRQWLGEGRKPSEMLAMRPYLAAGEHQNKAEAAAPWRSKRITSAEEAANDGCLG